MVSHVLLQVVRLALRLALVKVEQDVVAPELGLVLAHHPLQAEVVVDLLDGGQALGQVLRVELGVELVDTLLAEALGAENVKTGAFFHQAHTHYRTSNH